MSHSFTDDTIDSRHFKSKAKSLNRGHSLEENVPDGGGHRLKSAVSESMLSGDSTLGVPVDRKATSKLSLLGDKIGDAARDAARALAEKGTKKAKTPFTIFKKKSSRDPSPNDKNRTRSQEYGSLDRKKIGRSGPGRSPNRTSTLPLTRISDDADGNGTMGAPMINMEAPRGMIPYEFQESMGRGRDFGSDGSDPDLTESELIEMNAWAEHIDEYYYSVRIFPGQDPSQVFVGWMTPGFHSIGKHFDTKKIRHTVVSVLDQDYRIKTR